jgi:hypothetical protein
MFLIWLHFDRSHKSSGRLLCTRFYAMTRQISPLFDASVRPDLNIHGLLRLRRHERQRRIRMPTAISIAKIAMTIRVITSVAMPQLLK